MKTKKIIFIGCALIAIFLLWQLDGEAIIREENEIKPQKPQYAPGVIIVKFKSEIADIIKEKVHQKGNLIIEGSEIEEIVELPERIKDLVKDNTTLEPVYKGLHRRMRQEGKTEAEINEERYRKLAEKRRMPTREPKNYNLSNVYTLKNIDTKDKSIEQIAQELSQGPDIEYAEPNYLMEIQMLKNDYVD